MEKEINLMISIWFLLWIIQLFYDKLKIIPSPLITMLVLWLILYSNSIFPKENVFIYKKSLFYLIMSFLPILMILYTTKTNKEISVSVLAFILFISIYYLVIFLTISDKRDTLYYDLLESNTKDISELKDTIDSLSIEDIKGLIDMYHPIHYLNNDSVFYPVNIEDIFIHYKKEIRINEIFFILKDELKSPNEIKEWAYGDQDNLDKVNSYIFVRPHPEGFGIFFNILFQYNLGKIFLSTRIGSHYFDSTQSYIIFNKNREPIYTGCQSHSSRFLWKWKNNDSLNYMYGTKNKKQDFIDNHPVFYHAKDGNEVYPFTGSYTYENMVIIKLTDYIKKGKIFDISKNYILFKPENYHGINNFAIDKNNNSISLEIPEMEIRNWSLFVKYIGNNKMNKILFTDVYKLFGPIFTKWAEYRQEELKYKINIT